jgi:hypothetical protein
LVEGVDGGEVTYLDIHVLLRLFLRDLEELRERSKKRISWLRLQPFWNSSSFSEPGRLQPTASKLIGALEHDLGLRICKLPFRTVVEHTSKENWGRDPFDRPIVGNAKANDATLVT